jgi:hypothetical protein
MNGSAEFAIVSGIPLWEVGDGEAKAGRVATGFDAGTAAPGRLAADQATEESHP